MSPFAGGSRLAEPSSDPTYDAYVARGEEDTDGSTDSDTSSDSGQEELPMPDTTYLSQAEAAEQIYTQYRRAKRTWRRFTGKPVRKFRRHFRHFRKRKGKGKGKGHGKSFLWTWEDTLTYLKGKGKASRSHTSGKGFGRRKNPKDRQGNIMKCRICNSEEHFAAKCPSKGGGKGSSPAPPGYNFSAPERAASGSRLAEARGSHYEIGRAHV